MPTQTNKPATETIVEDTKLLEAPESHENPAVTQTQVVESMPEDKSVASTQSNDSVVQFAPSSTVETVNDLIEDSEPDRKTSKWVMIIVVLVLLILALGAGIVYYFSQFSGSSNTELVSPMPEESAMMPTPVPSVDEELVQLQQVNESDEVEAIKKDAENTDLNSLGGELDEIEGSL